MEFVKGISVFFIPLVRVIKKSIDYLITWFQILNKIIVY